MSLRSMFAPSAIARFTVLLNGVSPGQTPILDDKTGEMSIRRGTCFTPFEFGHALPPLGLAMTLNSTAMGVGRAAMARVVRVAWIGSKNSR